MKLSMSVSLSAGANHAVATKSLPQAFRGPDKRESRGERNEQTTNGTTAMQRNPEETNDKKIRELACRLRKITNAPVLLREATSARRSL